MKKYLSAVLALTVFVSLALVPTTAAAPVPVAPPDEQAACGAIAFSLVPLGPPNIWFMGVSGASGPWMLCYSALPGSSTYKGCPFFPGHVTTFFGPYTGGVIETFSAPAGSLSGVWQVISATQTSAATFIP